MTLPVYDPLTYRTLVARAGEVPYKFWSVNKFIIDAAAAGVCTLQRSDAPPLDTTKIWLDLTIPEESVGAVKAYNGSGWVPLTPVLFYAHLAGVSSDLVTDAELIAYVTSQISNHTAATDPHPQYATKLHPATLKPAFMLIQANPIRDIWWGGMDTTASTPRTYTISSVAGADVTLTANMVPEILHTGLHDVVLIRVWNTSKTPAQAAWVKYQVSVNTFTVSNAAHISGWLTGETLRLGDPNPTSSNVLSMIAIDISPYMQAHLGAVFPQKGLKVAIATQGVGGLAGLDISGNGAFGSAFGSSSNSDGGRQQAMFDVFTDQLSPVSNSNLFFVRETLISGTALANTRLVRLAGIYV